MIGQSHLSISKTSSICPISRFTQVRELLEQYTEAVGQAFDPEVITAIHKQTAGQPFLVNRSCANSH